MSDNDFIIVDTEERDEPVSAEEKKEVTVSESEEEKHEDEYEKVCFMCHRPESVAGKMIDMPNHITICQDCMQRSFDTMNNSSLDFNKILSNIPGIQFLNLSDLDNAVPKRQKIKKKKEAKEGGNEEGREGSKKGWGEGKTSFNEGLAFQ